MHVYNVYGVTLSEECTQHALTSCDFVQWTERLCSYSFSSHPIPLYVVRRRPIRVAG
jgi:hypothetical protein